MPHWRCPQRCPYLFGAGETVAKGLLVPEMQC